VALVVAAVLLAASAATAKDFGPGDLRVCNHSRCVVIMGRSLPRALSTFIYGEAPVRQVPRLRPGARAFELRFADGYTFAMVGPADVDRFASFGVICGRFQRGRWYLLPGPVAAELRRLTAPLRPLRVPKVLPPSC
jgi:hypothetical protein